MADPADGPTGWPDLPSPPPWSELTRRPIALFLDVDGTLVEFERRPEHVRATEGLVLLLIEVAERLGGALALISGRPLSDLDRIFAPWKPYAAGVHGVQVRGPEGLRNHHPDPAQLALLRLRADQVAQLLPGVWVEDKGVGVALHHRDAPDAAHALAVQVQSIVEQSRGTFEAQPGVLVQEIRPSGWDKGAAVRELMESPPFSGRRPVVVGDDLTDEHAFAAALSLGGTAVLVGSRRATAADSRLDSPSDVRGWLAELVEEVRS
ncbi:MAG: trehalose-phosphatase [Actinomycetes bacterium]